MDLQPIPNRAPDFGAKYRSKELFVARKKAALIGYGKPNETIDFNQLEELKTSRRLPRGFSNRMFSHEVTKALGGRIVSEHVGTIGTLLLSVPRERPKLDPLHARHYRALFKELVGGSNYVILCDPANRDEILDLAADAGVVSNRLTFAFSPRFNYSIWAQDAYVALNDVAGGLILLEGVCFPRGEDMTIADDVSAQTEISHLQSYLYFQGGNVLGGEQVTLIGMDHVQRNVGRFGLETEQKVLEAFQASLGTEMLPLGGDLFDHFEWYERGILSGEGYQPIFHIDMYVTATGIKDAAGKEIIFLGRPEAAKAVVGVYSDIAELNTGLYNSLFDKTEEILATRFSVHYLPLWITRSNLGQPTWEERYYNLTFNNCIVQSSLDKKHVLLPAYSGDATKLGLDQSVREALEKAAAEAWKKIGFTVGFMDSIEDLAYGSGAVHCITKTLSRRV